MIMYYIWYRRGKNAAISYHVFILWSIDIDSGVMEQF